MNEFKDIESKTELLKKEFESFKESSETEKLDLVKKFTGDLSRVTHISNKKGNDQKQGT